MENAARLATFHEAEWSKTADPKSYDSEASEESDYQPQVEYECVACRKSFKTEKQVEMHEKSKKHLKSVRVLKHQMRKEGMALGLDDGSETNVAPYSYDDKHNHGAKIESSDSDGAMIDSRTDLVPPYITGNCSDNKSTDTAIGEDELEISGGEHRNDTIEDMDALSLETAQTEPSISKQKKPRRRAKEKKPPVEVG